MEKDLKKNITERFIECCRRIKNDANIDYKDISVKIGRNYNSISNLIAQNENKQNRYVSVTDLYYLKKIFNINTYYILTLSNQMYLSNDLKDENMIAAEPNNIEYQLNSYKERINQLEKIISDKNTIIELQNKLLNN